MQNKRFFSANDYFLERFKKKVARVTIDIGSTCPNRDGTIGINGCLFCSESGSGDFCYKNISIEEQIEKQIKIIEKKWNNFLLLPYFQSFSNTYGNINYLEKKYYEALNFSSDIIGLSIATRPDCINKKVVEVLEKISNKYYLQIELGLQTINEKSAQLIERGYTLQTFEKALEMLKRIKIDITIHIILNLPGENFEDYLNTIRYISSKNEINGIKIHMLYIMKNSRLYNYFLEKPFYIMTKEEYVNTVCNLLRYLRKDIVVHRLTGDPPWKDLFKPEWATDKKNILNMINKKMEKENIKQGDFVV